MASRLVETQGTEEVYYCSRLGAVLGLVVSGSFIALGLTVMHDAGLFRWAWLAFSGFIAAMCLRGLVQRQEFARIGLEGVTFSAARLPLIPWERIVGIELGPNSEWTRGGHTRTTEAKRPILLRLDGGADDLKSGKPLFNRGLFSEPDTEGRVTVRIDGSFCPIKTAQFVERLRFFRGDTGLEPIAAVASSAKAQAEAKGASLGAVIFITVWSCGFVGLGGMFAVQTAGQMLEGLAARDWPEAQGHVLTSEVKERRGKKGRYTYRAEVTYDYVIDRRRFTGNRIDMSDVRGAQSEARSVAAEYAVGTAVRVRFKPDDPRTSLLRPGIPADLWVPLGIGTVFSIIGCLVAGMVYRSYFRARKAARKTV